MSQFKQFLELYQSQATLRETKSRTTLSTVDLFSPVERLSHSSAAGNFHVGHQMPSQALQQFSYTTPTKQRNTVPSANM